MNLECSSRSFYILQPRTKCVSLSLSLVPRPSVPLRVPISSLAASSLSVWAHISLTVTFRSHPIYLCLSPSSHQHPHSLTFLLFALTSPPSCALFLLWIFMHGPFSFPSASPPSEWPYCSVSVEQCAGCYLCPNVMAHGCGILAINNLVSRCSVQDRTESQRESNLLSPSRVARRRRCK